MIKETSLRSPVRPTNTLRRSPGDYGSKGRPTRFAAASLGLLGLGSAEGALLASYQLEESGAGLANGSFLADSSGNGYTADVVAPSASSVVGVVGSGINFGVDGYATTNIPAGVIPTGSSPRTIDAFFNSAINGGAQGVNAIFGYGAPSAGEYFQMTYENGSAQGAGSPGLFLRHFGGWIQYGSDLSLAGSWHHIAVRVNPGATDFNDVEVFLDGSLLSVAASSPAGLSTGINTGESDFVIGSSVANPAATDFIGSLDEVRIHDTALSNGEILAQASIPEPSAAVLSLLSLFALARRRR